VLIVTPELTFLPHPSGMPSLGISARAGGLADISAALVNALYALGTDLHVAIPNYRHIFKRQHDDGASPCQSAFPSERIHLAHDRCMFYRPRLSMDTGTENVKIALAFQREVIQRIIPEVQPDVVHCHDWPTGLIPAMTREAGIPCLFTLYHLNTVRLPLAVVEDCGLDAAAFWQHCYYDRMPANYEETRETNPVDFLLSGVFSAHFANTVSRRFLQEIVSGDCGFVAPALQWELGNKARCGCLRAVAQAPDPSFNPESDAALLHRYTPRRPYPAKLMNKLHLQELLHLRLDSTAPMFYWPIRLDGARPGCSLVAESLPVMLQRYNDRRLQVVFVADGDFQDPIRALARECNAADRVAVRDFDARLYRLAFAASDFVLMPRLHEPCGLPCKIGQRYGALPIAHRSGAVADAVSPIDSAAESGNGFVFEVFDAAGLLWAVARAMEFDALPYPVKSGCLERIMTESLTRDDHRTTAMDYIALYEDMLQRPFVDLRADPPEETVFAERTAA
jgi:glycogen synthase